VYFLVFLTFRKCNASPESRINDRHILLFISRQWKFIPQKRKAAARGTQENGCCKEAGAGRYFEIETACSLIAAAPQI